MWLSMPSLSRGITIVILFIYVEIYNVHGDVRDLFPANRPADGLQRAMRATVRADFTDRTIATPIIPAFKTKSVLACVLSCIRYYCLAFFFNENRMECKLNHYSNNNINKTVQDPGSLYYLSTYETCPTDEGYVYYPTENFCIKLNTTKVSYMSTHYYCLLDRASLVRLDSFKKLSIVKSYLKSIAFDNQNDFAYIMSKPIIGTPNFAFDDDLEMPYYDWIPGQPDNYEEHIVIGGNSQQMDDVDQYEAHEFICEKFVNQPAV